MDDRVSIHIRLAYAAPAFALAVVGIPIYVYLPKFYSDVIGVPVVYLGTLLSAVRIFDAVTDPVIGSLSDHTRNRFGRRRPYIAGASIPLAVCIFLLFSPPQLTPKVATLWFGVGIFALFLFWTLVAVPYESLGPEITLDYDERTSLLGTRDGALIGGTLVAASSPAVIGWLIGLQPGPESERAKLLWVAILYGPLVVAACLWCFARVRERFPNPHRKTGSFMRDFHHVLKNRPFMILLVSFTLSAFGSNLPATLILYYVEYVLQSQRADLFLVLYFVSGIMFLPGWILLARKTRKKVSWLLAMALNTGAFVGVFFLGPGDEAIYGVLVFLSGIGFGATLAIPSAMQADVIDYHELLTGERHEGHYIGVWSIAKKLAAALGIGLALALLGKAGYRPNVEQPQEVVFMLRFLYALVPCICNVIAFGVALAYPMDRLRHRATLAAIAKRKHGLQVEDPLRPGHVIG